MNLVQSAPIWLILVLCAVLAAAAIEDMIRLRISNVTVVATIATALVAMTLGGWQIALWQNFLVFTALLLVGTVLFASEILGGGDVKLFAAIGLWVDLAHAAQLVAAVLISGGILALIVLAPRFVLQGKGRLKDRNKGIPYAVAIAIGMLLVIGLQRSSLTNPRPSPLEFHVPAAHAGT